jgi:predicted Zn-dependent protease
MLMVPLWGLAGCSVNPATGEQSFTAFMPPETEIDVGRSEHPKIVEQFGSEYKDARFTAYVRDVGLKLARVSDMPNLPFTITVLNDPKVNAFALPGGFVYVTRGLLALAGNEAEMAGVLAHEIGHVTARHTAERYSQAMAANIGLTLLGVLTGGSQAAGAVNQAAGLGAQLYLQGYSREQELEADMLGVRYLSQAGYDPNAMTSFFRKMRAQTQLDAVMAGRDPGEADRFSFMSTHPRTVDRIAQAARLAKAAPVRDPKTEQAAFLARLDGLTFGDDRGQGVRRGRKFSHPDLRFEFTVPPNFTMFNSSGALTARGPNGAVIIFDMAPARQAQAARDVSGYVASQWGANLGLSGLERITIDGLEAATGAARVQTSEGVRDVRLVAIRGRDGRIFRFMFLTSPAVTQALAVELKRTTYSFRRLGAAEAAAIRPLKIKTVTVKAGDTVQSLAAHQPPERFRLEWFEVLNDVSRHAPVPAGRVVKVISE